MKKCALIIAILSVLPASSVFASKVSFDSERKIVLEFDAKKEMPLIEDDKFKTLENLKRQSQDWQLREEFASNWNLESSGLYQVDNQTKQKSLIKSVVRFSERKVKNYFQKKKNDKNKDDLFYEQASSSFKKDFYLTYSTVLLKGKVKFELHNPYFTLYSQYSFSDKDEVVAMKRFTYSGLLTKIIYSPIRQQKTFITEQPISEHLLARLSDQDFKEQRVELVYSTTF
jgi:hypothetical protein